MFINEGNMVGGAEQKEVTDDNNWYIIFEIISYYLVLNSTFLLFIVL